MANGHLYVLSNSAMPGLIKVGKTTRPPAERLAELSSATGVPSPFVMVYHQPVIDCDYAEKWVHFELERTGFRVANNREFFNAPLHEIVRIVSLAANLSNTEIENQGDTAPSNENSTPEQLADELYQLGEDSYLGTETVLRNRAKAYKYFEQAAGIGHAQAMSKAAFMLMTGNGVTKNLDQALYYYNAAISAGRWWERGWIAQIFFENEQHTAAQSQYKQFFAELADSTRRKVNNELLIEMAGAHAGSYCALLIRNMIPPVVAAPDIISTKDVIIAAVQREADREIHLDPSSKLYYDQQMEKLLKYFEAVQRQELNGQVAHPTESNE